MTGALLAVQALEVLLSRVQGIIAAARQLPDSSAFFGLVGLSWKKLVAAAAVLAMVRALVLWPEWLRMQVDLDSIAYALLIGEAFWQTLMVLVHRRYAAYCQWSPDEQASGIRRDLVRVVPAVLVYGLVAAAGAAVLGQLGLSIAGFSDWLLVAQMIGFFAAISLYLLLRYAIWVIKDFDWRLTLVEIGLILAQAAVVVLLPVVLCRVAHFWRPRAV